MYRDSSDSIPRRIDDLLGRMTLEEKVAQLAGVMPMALVGRSGLDPDRMQRALGDGIGHISGLAQFGKLTPEQVAVLANGIQQFLIERTRLGIPAIVHNEALNGLLAFGATSFPTAIGLAATWDPDLIEQMAAVAREQARAIGITQVLSPVMDIARDGRWGRVHETYGEDPYLASAMSVAFVRGMQGLDLKHGVAATGKHFLGYALTEGGMNLTATHLGRRELWGTFARPFEAAIRDAGLASIMNSYSEVDGVPCGASSEVLTDLLRERLGFGGVVVSDYDAIAQLVERTHVAADLQAAGIQALAAGIDVELPNAAGFGANLVRAVREGKASEALVDRAVRRVLEAKFELGLFEQPFVDPVLVPSIYQNPAGRALAREVALKSITLLKNEGDLLPLKTDLSSIAVIGPHADSVRALFSWYTYPAMAELLRGILLEPEGEMSLVAGVFNTGDAAEDESAMLEGMGALLGDIVTAPDIETFIRSNMTVKSLRGAIADVVSSRTQVNYAQGCEVTGTSTEGFTLAVEAARRSDVVILALGGKSGWVPDATESEGRDRTRLELPAVQQQLLEAVHAVGKPVVLVLFNGGPLSVNWAAEHVPAILEAYYPGETGAEAVAAVLFGKANPGGRLPITVPRSVGQVPLYHYQKAGSGAVLQNMELRRYTDQAPGPLYPFGYGLSYSKFEYSDLTVSPAQINALGTIEIACTVANVSERAGDEVVQLYLHDRVADVTRPVQELAGFKRVALDAGAACTVTFQVPVTLMAFYDRQYDLVVEPGTVDVTIGPASSDIRLRGELVITGDKVNVQGRRAFLSTAHVSNRHKLNRTEARPSEPLPASPPAPFPSDTAEYERLKAWAKPLLEAKRMTIDDLPDLLRLLILYAGRDPLIRERFSSIVESVQLVVNKMPAEHGLWITFDRGRFETGRGKIEPTLTVEFKDEKTMLGILTGTTNPQMAALTGKVKVTPLARVAPFAEFFNLVSRRIANNS